MELKNLLWAIAEGVLWLLVLVGLVACWVALILNFLDVI